MDSNNNRNTLLLAFILLMIGGVALLEESALIVMILLGLLFLVRQFDTQNLQQASAYDYEDIDYEYGDDESDFEDQINRLSRPAQSEPVYRHALEAVSRAGHDPDSAQVLAVDIGVMAFKAESDEPVVFRTWSLPDDVDYVQPFVQLRIPQKASGRVRFEIVDGEGQAIFVHVDDYNLNRGRNFITPAARLPVHEELSMAGRWRLRVSADDMLIADHRFQFSEATNDNIRRHIGEDGEITTEMRAVMAESRLPKMSLDDLLAYQEQEQEDEQQQRASK